MQFSCGFKATGTLYHLDSHSVEKNMHGSVYETVGVYVCACIEAQRAIF